jgi:hypothetical protein
VRDVFERIKRRSATHANSDAGIRGLKPHGYRQETAPRFFKTSKLQSLAGMRGRKAPLPAAWKGCPTRPLQGARRNVD